VVEKVNTKIKEEWNVDELGDFLMVWLFAECREPSKKRIKKPVFPIIFFVKGGVKMTK
jgi:hypothetical protein